MGNYLLERPSMKWLLIVLCVNVSNPKDIPGKLTLEFESKHQCETSLASMTYWLKFDSFKVVAKCEEA
jgi:hypothetical protein